jgi:hypothetical protein
MMEVLELLIQLLYGQEGLPIPLYTQRTYIFMEHHFSLEFLIQ